MISIVRKIIFVIIIPSFLILGLFLSSQNSKSYDDQTTHPGLTDEIVDFYNLSFDTKLTSEEKEWIVQGAMSEDTPPRWINHFYDPIYRNGWSGEETGIWPTIAVQYLSSGALSSENPVSSLNWIHNQELQSKYGAYQGNRTWERAIYEMVKNGNKREAYYTLGFILHLIEDATVPDHTRNDTHAHELKFMTGDYGSPYEEFSKQYTRETLNIAKEFKQKGDQPASRSSIDDYLISLAEYSNKYFFSKDTISNEKYSEPDIKKIREENGYGYGKDENGKEFPIVNIAISRIYENGEYKKIENYFLPEKDNNALVLKNYFSRLSRAAVLNGAGVINLFNQEVAKAEKDKLQELPKESSAIWSAFGRGIQLYNSVSSAIDNTINKTTAVVNNTINETAAVINNAVDGVKDIFSQSRIVNPMASVANIGQIANNIAVSNEQLAVSNKQPEIVLPLVGQGDRNDSLVLEVEAATQIQQNQSTEVELRQIEIIHAPYQPLQNQVIHAPYQAKINSISVASSDGSIFVPTGQYPNIYINSPSPQLSHINDQCCEDQPPEKIEPQEQDIIPPEKPIITTNNSQNFAVLTAEIILEGVKTKDAKEILINDSSENIIYPTTTSWQKLITLMMGENIFEVKAKDEAGNISESAVINIIFKEPLINFYLTDYDVRKINFTLNWGDDNNVIKNWELEYKLTPDSEWGILRSTQNDNGEIARNNSGEVAQNTNGEMAQNNTEGNSYTFIAQHDDLTYYFRLRGDDALGNRSAWRDLQAEIFTKPVVINEIAWMGTQASSSDEWIELYNKTSKDIDLAGWILESPDGSPKIEFDENYKNKVKNNESKIPTIKAKSYFLLERTNDDTTSEEGDWFFSGALNDINFEKDEEERKQVEGLVLKYGDEVMDQIDLWYAGEKSGRKSMERISPFYSGNDIDNWKDNDENRFNGKDAKGNNILGTPKQKNSAIKIIDGEFDRDVNFYAFPDVEYLISDFKLKEDYSLTAHPGAVLKFKNNGKLEIKGALFAEGAKDKKIYFTSENDDLVGSDINADGNFLSPERGDWDGIYIENSARAQWEWVEIKYADNALSADSADVRISNSLLSYFSTAIYLQDGDLTVLNNIFEGSGDSRSIYTSGGTLTLRNNVFRNNKIPLYVDYKTNLMNSGNIAGENEYTGTFLYSEDDDYKYDFNRTLYKDLPYIFVKDLVVEDGAELTLEPGVVVKFGKFPRNESSVDIYGKLIAMGTPEDKIVITSFNDDLTGGKIFKGDYNGYAADYWSGLNFYFGSQNSLIENFVLRKSDDGMYFDGVTMNLTGVEIAGSEDDGITGHNSVLNFKDSHFTDIKGNGFVIYDGSVASISSTVMENIDGNAIVVFGNSALTLENSLIKNIGGDGGDAVIVFNDSVIDIVNSVLKNGENDGVVIFDDSAINISDSTLENFQGSAVLVVDDDISVNIKDSVIKNNDYGVNIVGDSLVNVSGSAIYDNSQYGIFNDTAENTNVVSAQNNWWGDGSGPYHQELNESGVGNEVSDGVNFAPWTENSGE